MIRRLALVAAAGLLAGPALAEQSTMTQRRRGREPARRPARHGRLLRARAARRARGHRHLRPALRHDDVAAPMRIVMALADGDDVAFAIPGYPQSRLPLQPRRRRGHRLGARRRTAADAASAAQRRLGARNPSSRAPETRAPRRHDGVPASRRQRPTPSPPDGGGGRRHLRAAPACPTGRRPETLPGGRPIEPIRIAAGRSSADRCRRIDGTPRPPCRATRQTNPKRHPGGDTGCRHGGGYMQRGAVPRCSSWPAASGRPGCRRVRARFLRRRARRTASPAATAPARPPGAAPAAARGRPGPSSCGSGC